MRVPRVCLPEGGTRQVEPDWTDKLAGFTLQFEALVVALRREMPFTAVARVAGYPGTTWPPSASATSIWRSMMPTSPRSSA